MKPVDGNVHAEARTFIEAGLLDTDDGASRVDYDTNDMKVAI